MVETFGSTRGYVWPPFEPGDTADLRHGANSGGVITTCPERNAAGLAAAQATPGGESQ